MKNTLFWRLSAAIIFATLALFSLINYLTDETEWSMSFIKEKHQDELLSYAKKAEELYLQGDEEQLTDWLNSIQHKEDTWVAIVKSTLTPIMGTSMDKVFIDNFRLGRSIEWKLHLDMNYRPIMELTFSDQHTHFLIRLPERMRPGNYWKYTHLLLQVVLPLIPLLILTILIYRYLMFPLHRLRRATRKFSEGDLSVRVRPSLGLRNDELTDLADTFDHMADNTSQLIIKQRQLIADLSHELRTPITRIELAIGGAKQGISTSELIPRLEKETKEIRTLVEDTLTLAWLENEKPTLIGEHFNLIELIEVIVEDAKFEFPKAQFNLNLPSKIKPINCSQQALSQALENLIRNALKYSPTESPVSIDVKQDKTSLSIYITDQGIGVPEAFLESIFQPFFRVDKSRGKETDGFGLGLALARRQIESIPGTLHAVNKNPGLQMQIIIKR